MTQRKKLYKEFSKIFSSREPLNVMQLWFEYQNNRDLFFSKVHFWEKEQVINHLEILDLSEFGEESVVELEDLSPMKQFITNAQKIIYSIKLSLFCR